MPSAKSSRAKRTAARTAAVDETLRIAPQPGPQTAFFSSPADIVIYGGGAGGGKSFALLLEPLRHIGNERFGCTIFRRNSKMVQMQGGLWDESSSLYPQLGAKPNSTDLEWTFPSGAAVKFAHLEHEKNKFDYQGAQITLIGFDELPHFTASQFWYMLSRNRSTCGIRPYVRATCNPEADSWVADLISWWINQETGFPIKERAGVVRWFIRSGEDLIWADTAQELVAMFPDAKPGTILPKSLTFIPASVYDNQALLSKDPGYLANLMAQPLVDRERLLSGNWKIRPSAGLFFKSAWFEVVEAAPIGGTFARVWDLAGTKARKGKSPDWTVGMLIQRTPDGWFIIHDIIRIRESPLVVEQTIYNTATQDGRGVMIILPEDPAQAGKFQAAHFSRKLAGWDFRFVARSAATGNKVTNAKPASAQAEAGNIKLVRGDWNKPFLLEGENFPDGANDDQIDTLADGVNVLSEIREWDEDMVG